MLPLSQREYLALAKLDEAELLAVDYWEDATIRMFRGFGLVQEVGGRIALTSAGLQVVSEFRRRERGL